ncbi:MAG: hypothetical protein KDA59_24245, partial [Planctomycetales bacterium]|nr:hypothetical protein [Planctomycetales bacterium]
MYKGQSNTGVITINDLVLAGGHIAHQNGTGDLFQLAGNISVTAPSTVDAKQGNIEISSAISGSGDLTIAATDNNADATQRIVTLLGENTLTGNVNVSGKLRLGTTGSLTFDIGSNGVNNAVVGTGWAEFNGVFHFDLTGASSTLGDSWTIVDVAAPSFGSSFGVAGFTEINDVWTSGMYRFAESTGILSVSAAPGDVNGDGFVNDVDYQIILAHLEQPASSRGEGDLNGDGVV